MKKILWTFAILIVLIVLAAGLSRLGPSEEGNGSISTEGWQTFTSERFDFEIKYPNDWKVAAHPDDVIAPAFNFYKPGTAGGVESPYTHHNDVVQVSVFPDGVPTEGIFGQSATSSVAFNEPTRQSLDFLLEDGTPWATYANFTTRPDSWTEPGFVFARANIEELETVCVSDGNEVSQEQCDPFLGDTIVRRGSVDEQERAIQVAMLESFRFIDDDDESASDGGSTAALPQFDQYPIDEGAMWSGDPATVDFTTNPDAKRFETRIREEALAGPNFAGHYTVATWGCGTNCGVSAILDARTGEIVEYGLVHEYGLEYRLGSRLLVVNPLGNRPQSNSGAPATADYYVFNDGALQHIGKFSAAGEALACAQVITTAENPITGEERTFPTPCHVPAGWQVTGR